jgi:hypothetical protein
LSYKEGVDYFGGSAALLDTWNIPEITDEQKQLARKYMIKHDAEDLLEVVGL